MEIIMKENGKIIKEMDIEYIINKMEGYGIFYCPNGDRYKGE